MVDVKAIRTPLGYRQFLLVDGVLVALRDLMSDQTSFADEEYSSTTASGTGSSHATVVRLVEETKQHQASVAA